MKARLPVPRLAAFAAALLLAAPLDAQVVRGQVTRSGQDRPVPGAMVVLLDSAGAQRAAVLTGPDGSYALRASAPGAYTVRADVVGLPSTTSPALRLAAGQSVAQKLEITGEVVGLEPLRASASSRGRGACQVRPGTGEATALLWEEARKALNASAFTQTAELVRYDVVQYRRDLDAGSLAVKNEERSNVSKVVRTPFASIPAEALASGGFVQQKSDGTYYYGPDAAVLLSDVFLAGHCFEVRPTSADDPRLIGLAFRPAASRGTRDIEGVLWLDLVSSELRFLEYRYTGLPSGIAGDKLGGRVEFERLPQGAWIVKKWWIRMPALAQNTYTLRDYNSSSVRSRERRDELLGIREEGGEVLTAAQRQRGLAVGATLSGVVWDSVGNGALAGATVFVSGTAASTTSDAAGAYVLDGVPAGQHTVGFSHPLAQSLGVFPSRSVTVQEGDAVGVDLAIPSGPSVARALCGDRYRPGIGVLAGMVTDAAGRPVQGAKVQARWWRRGSDVMSTRHDGMETETDARGVYGLCGVNAELPLDVEVHAAGQSAEGEVRLVNGAGRRDFQVGRGAVAAAAAPGGGAVPVPGVTATARAEARGFAERRRGGNGRFLTREDIDRLRAARFTDLFRGIPGLQVISGPGGDQVRSSSAAPRRIASDMEGRDVRTGRPPVAPGAPPPTIDPDAGPAAIGKAGGDVMAPGVMRTEGETGDCEIRYYVDGVHFPVPPGTSISSLVRPDDVNAVEIYTRASQIPPQYRVPGSECGVILVWTRRTAG